MTRLKIFWRDFSKPLALVHPLFYVLFGLLFRGGGGGEGIWAILPLVQVVSYSRHFMPHLRYISCGRFVSPLRDSRAVLARGGKAVRLTYDHKAEDASERERVMAAGGFVLRNRVLGILAVSRSFGNQGMKEFVTSSPHISETRWARCLDTRLENVIGLVV